MDFKVAGTEKGITAIQMDIKIKGIDEEILRAGAGAGARGPHAYPRQNAGVPARRREEHLSKYAPKIIRFTIDPEKIREVIGPGGKMINKIIAETGVKIDIEDDGRVCIATPDGGCGARQGALSDRGHCQGSCRWAISFTGPVVRIMSFGAFVEIRAGQGRHGTHLEARRTSASKRWKTCVNIGDVTGVHASAEIDSQGRINLVRNDIVYDNEAMPVRRPPRREGGREGGRSRRRD